MALSEDEKDRLNGIREQLERNILTTFNGKEMWYQERTLQVKGIAHITTDEWGVSVNFESENREAVSLSGRWDVIIAYSNHLGAQYCGWSLDFECPYPEWESNTHHEQ
jgi:hypothetical protein